MLMVTALGLPCIFIAIGAIGMSISTGWKDMGWIILMIYPGAAGLFLALLSLGIKLVPAIKVASPYFASLSLLVTVSMVAYALGTMLLSLVWK